VQVPAAIAGGQVTGVVAGNEADPHFVGISISQKYANQGREMKSDKGDLNPSMTSEGRGSDLPPKDEELSGRSFAPAQGIGVAGEDSSSAAGGRGQGNPSDTHRGATDGKGSVAASQVLAPQTPQNGAVGVLGTGTAAHGHLAPVNSSVQSARESTQNTPVRTLDSLGEGQAGVARLLGHAMRGDLRVGVQTEAFGRVTIQTNAQGGQLSAQLSLENAKESATLAAHLPGVEQKIVQQHGLDASVRLVGAHEAGAGGSMGRGQSESGRRDPEGYRNDVMRSGMAEHNSPKESQAVEAPLLGRYLVSSRLDVTV
jgi:hypothetical protein